MARRFAFQRTRPMARLAVGLAWTSIALGAAVIIIGAAITYGYEQAVARKVTGFAADLAVRKYAPATSAGPPTLDTRDPYLEKLAETDPEVRLVAPFIMREAILKSDQTMAGVQLKGVPQAWNSDFFRAALQAGRLPDFSTKKYSKELLVSQKLADVIGAAAGDTCRLYFLQEGRARLRKVLIAGVYHTGMVEFDEIMVFCDIRLLRRILGLEPHETLGFDVYLQPGSSAEDAAVRINDQLRFDQRVETVAERYYDLFVWLEILHQNLYFILILMTLVAVVNMSTALIIMITERAPAIGLLKALGAREGQTRMIFVYSAAWLIVTGLAAGNLLAYFLMFLQEQFKIVTLDPDSYFVREAPVAWEWPAFAALNAVVAAVCIVCMLLPAMVAQRISPVRALQAEG